MQQDANHVVIVGAGAIGVSTAYHLAEAGTTVTLLDKGHAAGETTGKAAGLVYAQVHYPADVRAMQYSQAFFRDLADQDNQFEYHETGYLRLGTDAERAVLEHEAEMHRDLGVDVRTVDPDEIASLEPSLDLAGITNGTYAPGDGHADPHTYTTTLLAEAEERGVAYRPNTPVVGFGFDGGDREVRTEEGRIDADTVVIAAGPWSKRLARVAGGDVPLKPYRAQALVTTGVEFDIGAVYDTHDEVYFRPEGDGLLVGDGTDETESDPDDYKSTADFDFLTKASGVIIDRLPVDEVQVRNSWVGLSTATPDEFPLVGHLPAAVGASDPVPDTYVATGTYGHGFMRSPAIGRMLAEAVVGSDDDPIPAEYRATRFEEDPGDFPISEMMKVEGKHDAVDVRK